MSREAHVRICESVRVKFPRATRPQFVEIDLGFSIAHEQYLRLREIDCPEISTSVGKKAKTFVEKCLKTAPFILLTSSRSDKYDRYLADVFYGEDRYLNQELLNAAFADRA